MSHFPSAPPPGAYVPPNQATPPAQGFNQQQQQQQQQQPQYGYGSQGASPYGQSAPTYGSAAAPHKSTNAFGSVFNQAVTQGKPMLNKLGKTISSKLGSKPPSHSTPQHLESFQNYQQHQQQNQSPNYQTQGQQFNPQPQQQQQQHSTYQTPQQSPFPPSQYGTPASGNTWQNNYFPQQTSQAPNAQVPQSPQSPQQQPNAPSYGPQGFGQGGIPPGQQQAQPTGQEQFMQGQSSGLSQPNQVGDASGQQTGIIGGQQGPPQNMNAQGPPTPNAAPSMTNPNSSQQQQWAPPPPSPAQVPSPIPQQAQTFNHTPPPQQQYNAGPPLPSHPNQRQWQQPQQQQQQQWTSTSPASPQVQTQNEIPPSVSPPPPQPSPAQQKSTFKPEAQQQIHTQQPTPAPQEPPPQAGPTEFLAELPADMGNLTMMESSKPQQAPSNQAGQGVSYQAYRPQGPGQSPSPASGFSIARRAVSTSSLPIADPWRYADPTTELPTREFYILADLLYDAIDRKFEPQGTGLLEASKVLESWKVTQGLEEQAAQLFAYDSYTAFAKLWSLEGVPHIMVPCQASLMPVWNFQRQSHEQELRMPAESSLANSTYPTYMPALNRAGWYKQFFLDVMNDAESVEKLVPTVCGDAYKPSILNQPDLQRRDRTEVGVLSSRAKAICNAAVSRACQEVAAQMQGGHRGGF